VAEGGGLLNRYRVVKPYRGFESLRLRQSRTELPTPGIAGFAPAAVSVVLLRLVLVEQRHDLPHQLIEHVAEPCLEYVELGFGGRPTRGQGSNGM
jgi:hypothetical protein